MAEINTVCNRISFLFWQKTSSKCKYYISDTILDRPVSPMWLATCTLSKKNVEWMWSSYIYWDFSIFHMTRCRKSLPYSVLSRELLWPAGPAGRVTIATMPAWRAPPAKEVPRVYMPIFLSVWFLKLNHDFLIQSNWTGPVFLPVSYEKE